MKTLSGADGIRALACLMVIVHHASQRLSQDYLSPLMIELQYFAMSWRVGVSGFFVLSGFLLSMPFWQAFDKQEAMPTLREYVFRRLARIAPGYYAALIICYLIQGPTPDAVQRLIAGLSFTAGFHWSTWFPSEINGPLWSISLEVFCYALLPLGMWAMFRHSEPGKLARGLRHWLIVLAVTLVANQLIQWIFHTPDQGKGWQFGLQGGAKTWLPNYNPIGFFAHYILGVLAAGSLLWLRNHAQFAYWQNSHRFDLGALAALLTLFGWLWIARNSAEFGWSLQNQPYHYPIVPLCFAAALCLLACSHTLGEWLDNPVSRFVATLSFGLYLWHYAVMEVMQQLFAKDFQYMGVTNLQRFAGLNLIMIGITLTIAMLSWHYIEQPVLNAIRRRYARPEPASPIPAWE